MTYDDLRFMMIYDF